MRYALSALALLSALNVQAQSSTIHDKQRDRHIPVEINTPKNAKSCTQTQQCKVAFIGAGYRVEHSKYQFISKQLNEHGYFTVAIRHELPNDPPLSLVQPFSETRMENWQRGAKSVDVVRSYLAPQYANYDFDNLTLIGHSNGGDISALLANSEAHYIQSVITLDHRRVPLPRTNKINILSIRASDYPADPGVLPTQEEQKQFGSCVVQIDNAQHNDMSDYGPDWLKTHINKIIDKHLANASCEELKAL